MMIYNCLICGTPAEQTNRKWKIVICSPDCEKIRYEQHRQKYLRTENGKAKNEAYRKKEYQQNKEKYSARQKEYRKDPVKRARADAQRKIWRENNREKIRERVYQSIQNPEVKRARAINAALKYRSSPELREATRQRGIATTAALKLTKELGIFVPLYKEDGERDYHRERSVAFQTVQTMKGASK